MVWFCILSNTIITLYQSLRSLKFSLVQVLPYPIINKWTNKNSCQQNSVTSSNQLTCNMVFLYRDWEPTLTHWLESLWVVQNLTCWKSFKSTRGCMAKAFMKTFWWVYITHNGRSEKLLNFAFLDHSYLKPQWKVASVFLQKETSGDYEKILLAVCGTQ